ncbi:MAG: FAD-dependent oxidoreductase [Candidatus Peregrinibacteria bacterium]
MKMLIVGGGISGLTACTNLSDHGEDIQITLVEQQSRFGGLAKSFVYGGEYVFDIGPKRFHTEDEEVLGFLRKIAQACTLQDIGRSSKVHFLGSIFDWPLSPKALMHLPIGTGLRAGLDLLRARSFTEEELLSFRHYIVSQYGETLFNLFFRPYTEKFLRRPIGEIHSDWATTGINRSIINKEQKGNSLIELMQRILLPLSVDANFLYPRDGGFGAFWDACVTLLRRNPLVQLKTSTSVTQLISQEGGVIAHFSDGEQKAFDHVLWSGRLPDLLRATGMAANTLPSLQYIDTVFLNLVFRDSDIRTRKALCQWLYISGGHLQISRVSFPKFFVEGNIPPGYQGLCVEVTRDEDEPSGKENDLLSQVITELSDLGIIRSHAKPILANIHRERATYPVYHRYYRKAVADALHHVHTFSPRITPMGRSGSYWYNNADHSIKQSLKLTNDLLANIQPSFDCYGWFGGR